MVFQLVPRHVDAALNCRKYRPLFNRLSFQGRAELQPDPENGGFKASGNVNSPHPPRPLTSMHPAVVCYMGLCMCFHLLLNETSQENVMVGSCHKTLGSCLLAWYIGILHNLFGPRFCMSLAYHGDLINGSCEFFSPR